MRTPAPTARLSDDHRRIKFFRLPSQTRRNLIVRLQALEGEFEHDFRKYAESFKGVLEALYKKDLLHELVHATLLATDPDLLTSITDFARMKRMTLDDAFHRIAQLLDDMGQTEVFGGWLLDMDRDFEAIAIDLLELLPPHHPVRFIYDHKKHSPDHDSDHFRSISYLLHALKSREGAFVDPNFGDPVKEHPPKKDEDWVEQWSKIESDGVFQIYPDSDDRDEVTPIRTLGGGYAATFTILLLRFFRTSLESISRSLSWSPMVLRGAA